MSQTQPDTLPSGIWWRCPSPMPPFLMYSVCLSVWLVDTCLGASSYTLTDLSPPPIPPTPPHPSIPDHFPSGFRHSPSLSPLSNYLFSALFLPHCFLLLPSFPTCPFSPLCSSPILTPSYSHSPSSLFANFSSPAVHHHFPNPSPFKSFPISPAWPPCPSQMKILVMSMAHKLEEIETGLQ